MQSGEGRGDQNPIHDEVEERATQILKRAVDSEDGGGLPHNPGLEDTDPFDSPPAPSAGEPRHLCSLAEIDNVSYRFAFRDIVPQRVLSNRDFLNEAIENGDLLLACSRIDDAALILAHDVRYVQRWNLQKVGIADVSSVIALAPGERTTVKIKQTQRTTLTTSDMESSENLQSFDNTQIDKDILNVAKSTTRTNQWRVDSTATVSIAGTGSLSVSAGYSESTSETINRNMQRISEETRKSSQQLKNLQKTEVSQSQEFEDETSSSRRLENPYRDRSLMLNVYDLQKTFEVSTALSTIMPCLVLEIPKIRFDRDFVMNNVDFLNTYLLETAILDELRSALEVVQRPFGNVSEEEAIALARKALDMLFFEHGVMFPGRAEGGINFSINRSFTLEGLNEGVDNKLGVVYTTLAFYRTLYQSLRDEGDERNQQAIQLALSLSDAVGPSFISTPGDEIKNVLDAGNPSEVFRRLSGFTTIVDKLLKPLVAPIDEARMAQDARERANYVLDRAASHLRCHADYYVQRLLHYTFRRTDGLSMVSLFQDALRVSRRLSLLEFFDPSLGFVEGNRFVVPMRRIPGTAHSLNWGEALRGKPNSGGEPAPTSQLVIIPTEGVHIEPAAGNCVLDDVPPPTGSFSGKIDVSAGSITSSDDPEEG